MTAIATLMTATEPMAHRDLHEDAQTPTTPKLSSGIPRMPVTREQNDTSQLATSPRTPTKADFGAHLSQATDEGVKTQSHIFAAGAPASTDDAMELDQSDEEQDDSENEGEPTDADAASRKKKGQRFFCTGYPPCNLSFTRSEHLARHIRKHTGERPFQCHCNRRFSRLDNLRQHAQTVHVNEEIPTDSLAATGTRFQRQIRTDRVRPSGRSRAGTIGSTGSHSRGHSRNLSASSVGSTASNYSTTPEARRRPPPLLMANDGAGRPQLGLEPPATPPPQYRGYPAESPGDMSTPTSATYSVTPGSPGYGSTLASPMSSTSRLSVSGFWGSRTPARRLSVPTAPPGYQSPYSSSYGSSYPGQMGPPGSQLSSSNSSVYAASPVSSTFSYTHAPYIAPGEDWRRRTWHPSTYSGVNFNYVRPATSGLTYSQTPDAPQPSYAQHATAAAGQAPRLPGIESFDHAPPRRNASPMQMEGSPSSSFGPGPAIEEPMSKPGHISWDGVRSSQYPPLDDHGRPTTEPNGWAQQALKEIQSVGSEHEPVGQLAAMPPPQGAVSSYQEQQHIAREALQMQSSNKRVRRQGWYNAPLHRKGISPDSSSSEGIPTPRPSTADLHPAIMHSGGFIEAQHQNLHLDAHQTNCLVSPTHIQPPYIEASQRHRASSFAERGNGPSDMDRLEALVAVATSEENAPSNSR